MKEHALFLSLGFNYDDKQLIEEAQQFITVFERIEEQLSKFLVNSDPRQVKSFNTQVYQAVASIWCLRSSLMSSDTALCLYVRTILGGTP